MSSLHIHQVTPECIKLGSKTFPHADDEELGLELKHTDLLVTWFNSWL